MYDEALDRLTAALDDILRGGPHALGDIFRLVDEAVARRDAGAPDEQEVKDHVGKILFALRQAVVVAQLKPKGTEIVLPPSGAEGQRRALRRDGQSDYWITGVAEAR